MRIFKTITLQNRSHTAVITAVTITMIITAIANAGPVIHENITDYDNYGSLSDETGGENFDYFKCLAMAFTPAANAYLDSVKLGLNTFFNEPDIEVEVGIYTSTDGVPGALIESLGSLEYNDIPDDTLLLFGGAPSLLSAANPLLKADVEYFIVISRSYATSCIYWSYTQSGAGFWSKTYNGDWQYHEYDRQLCFRVSAIDGATITSTGSGQSHPNMQPSLAINHIIALQGEYPSRGSDSTEGTLIGEVCMFAGDFPPSGWAFADGQILPISANQTLYSILLMNYGGDGRTSFGLPDLRGRTAIHEGTGTGITAKPLGSKSGTEAVTLSVSQIPSHSHAMPPLSASTATTGSGQPHENMQPYLTLNYTIETNGIYPPRPDGSGGGNGPTYTGEIRRFAGNYAPNGRLFTAGQTLPISGNETLFSILQANYGGDGITDFCLPDLRGRTPVGAGQGTGLSYNVGLGNKFGVEKVSLTLSQMPSHGHDWSYTSTNNLTTGSTGGSNDYTNMQPSLGLNYIIALEGNYPERDGSGLSENFIGEVCLFAGDYAPDGWAFAHGQLLLIDEYPPLYSILSTRYGGNGVTTFGLPDLRGRIAVHTGTGPGLNSRTIGQKLGVDSVTLTLGQLPSHDHSAIVDTSDTDGDGVGDPFDKMPGCNDYANLYDGDLIINLNDFAILAQDWLCIGNCIADIDRDGNTDSGDLMIMAQGWLCTPD